MTAINVTNVAAISNRSKMLLKFFDILRQFICSAVTILVGTVFLKEIGDIKNSLSLPASTYLHIDAQGFMALSASSSDRLISKSKLLRICGFTTELAQYVLIIVNANGYG